jgi:hypothetical protein
LLAQHPEILALSPFRFEAKLTSYWTDLLRTLAEPASYMQMVLPEISDPKWWAGSRQSPLPIRLRDPDMSRWLGRENLEVIAGFAQSRIDSFYTELARVQNKPRARYCTEKCYPGTVPRAIAELYPKRREIVLVRDLRDMVCSIDDYNAKRGFELWGRDQATTDEQWFDHLRRETVKLIDGLRARSEEACLVRYEDLIRSPEDTLAAVLAYLEVTVDAGTVRRMIEDAKNEQPPKAKSFHQTSSSDEDSIGRWKRDMSAERVVACAIAFDEILVELGYEPTDEGQAATTKSVHTRKKDVSAEPKPAPVVRDRQQVG